MFHNLVVGCRSAASRVALAVGGVAVGASAFAQSTPSFDVTAITATITAVAAAGATVGAAYVATKIGIRAWKWITGAA